MSRYTDHEHEPDSPYALERGVCAHCEARIRKLIGLPVWRIDAAYYDEYDDEERGEP